MVWIAVYLAFVERGTDRCLSPQYKLEGVWSSRRAVPTKVNGSYWLSRF
jgi:hypothetical protein